MNTTTREPIDYAAARKRLQAATADAAALASFDCMVESVAAGDGDVPDNDPRGERWNEAMGGFLANAERLNIGLDYVFGGRGEPILPPRPDPASCKITSDILRLPDELPGVFATFVRGLADYERKQKIIGHKPKMNHRA